ncbi:hypothetical protein EZV62_021966 [Acer yangbiense]|uniref:Pentatricopeptide repeat-containing protein n=1 Tax=Acer yangbiense TaxID=1000413 RepID=A0A5C7H785_9ROSI|nr:hypothetical protein EZV62_021966 [Acer yangbiense]
MVNECFKLGKFSEAIDTFKRVGMHPKSKALIMDVAGYNNIIVRLCKNGMLEEMADSGMRVVLSFGTRVFSELINNSKVAECVPILIKLGEKDPKPDFLIYDVVDFVCEAFGQAGRGEEIEEVLNADSFFIAASLIVTAAYFIGSAFLAKEHDDVSISVNDVASVSS